MTIIKCGLMGLFLLPSVALSQGVPVTLPAGTQLPVSVPKHLPLKVGEPIRAALLYPVYQDDKLVLPAKTFVNGTVVSLTPDHALRVKARLRGDFTPYRTPVVRFDSIEEPTGPVAIETGTATDGAPIYKVVPAPAAKGGIAGEFLRIGVQHVKDTIAIITGPEKGDRFMQFIYHQLPWHPQRIQTATAWTVETSAAVTLDPIAAPVAVAAASGPAKGRHGAPVATETSETRPKWLIEAYLDEGISSETSKANQKIHATVAEPVMNADGSVAVPQGSVLSGTVSQAKPALSFTRTGVLRFSFTEITFPGQDAQAVRTTLAGADTSSGSQLAMDSEGEVKEKPRDKLLIPVVLLALAARPLDRDGGQEHHMFSKDAVASGSLGLVSFIVGTAARQPYLAAGLGYYSAAISIYPRFFAKGQKITFPKDTRIIVQTTAMRGAAMKPDATPVIP